MVANEVSVNVKTKANFKYDYFPVYLLSEKCIIFRSFKHQKRLKIMVRTKLSVDARMIKTLTSPLRS